MSSDIYKVRPPKPDYNTSILKEHADDVSYQVNSKIEEEIKEMQLQFEQFQADAEKSAKTEKRRFILQTCLSVASLTAAVIAAIAAIIPLL